MENVSKKKKKKTAPSFQKGEEPFALFMIIPSVIVIFGVMLYPIIYSFILSFNKLNLATRTLNFTGLKNYIAMAGDAEFFQSIAATLIFTVITVFFEMVLGMCMALVLNKDFKGCGFLRGIMILPWALPSVVNAVMWKWIYNANYGALNALLYQLHIIKNYHVWLGDPKSAFVCLVFANIWKETPYVVLLMLAGLSNISGELYEAARVDGSGGWKSFWKITFPLLKPVSLVLVITKTIWAIQTFDLVYILTGGGPANSTELISVYIQKMAFKFTQFGYGSAVSYVLMLVTFLLCLIYIKLTGPKSELS